MLGVVQPGLAEHAEPLRLLLVPLPHERGREAVVRDTFGEGPLDEVAEEEGEDQAVGEVEGDETDRPIGLDEQFLDHLAGRLVGGMFDPRLFDRRQPLGPSGSPHPGRQ